MRRIYTGFMVRGDQVSCGYYHSVKFSILGVKLRVLLYAMADTYAYTCTYAYT